ncbi:MAG: hypothetical protein KC656_31455, partial [Myxococcales bacterium]|nr:hypothetical protein [Myxococcales bacterium]
MGRVHATWCPEGASGGLFFWTPDGDLPEVLAAELPELVEAASTLDERPIVHAGPGPRRRKVAGVFRPLAEVLPLLPALRTDPGLSDSVRVWSMAARLGLELASRQAVVPSVGEGQARWRAMLHRREDRVRVDALIAALPVVARLVPTRDHGPVRIPTAELAVRGFLDGVMDALFRCGVWPGPARGWVLELADALRGDAPAFSPRDARSQGVPAKLAAWASTDR